MKLLIFALVGIILVSSLLFLSASSAYSSGKIRNTWIAGFTADSGTLGDVTSVSGEFTVPSVTCPSSGLAYAVYLVGMSTPPNFAFSAGGVSMQCNDGQESNNAVYVIDGNNNVTQPSNFPAVSPGDVIRVSVIYFSGKYIIKITDASIKLTMAYKEVAPNTATRAAFWGLWKYSVISNYPLAQFSNLVAKNNIATISGVTGTLGYFLTSTTSVAVTDWSLTSHTDPSIVLASSAENKGLQSGGSKFIIIWKSAGP